MGNVKITNSQDSNGVNNCHLPADIRLMQDGWNGDQFYIHDSNGNRLASLETLLRSLRSAGLSIGIFSDNKKKAASYLENLLVANSPFDKPTEAHKQIVEQVLMVSQIMPDSVLSMEGCTLQERVTAALEANLAMGDK